MVPGLRGDGGLWILRGRDGHNSGIYPGLIQIRLSSVNTAGQETRPDLGGGRARYLDELGGVSLVLLRVNKIRKARWTIEAPRPT